MRPRAILTLLTLLCAGCARGDLATYVTQPDPAYAWEQRAVIPGSLGTVYDLHMTSQKWQGITWQHRIQVFQPKEVKFPGTAVLLITGGNGSPADAAIGLTVANATNTLMGVLYNIPNEPLFGQNEDALIAYTFQKYLETGDESWPLLFPMVKSALRAMDTLQAFAAKNNMAPITRFIVAGASKRGWTTWLTATVDPRVKAIIPMVYDNLDLQAQMPHQLQTWGQYSEQIKDYTRRGIQAQMGSPRGRRLTEMVDPYTFRQSLSMPKLIVNGTNDPYWTLDALNIYWDQLPGPKWVLYDPNSGHGLDDKLKVLTSASAFIRAIAANSLPPKVDWSYEASGTGDRLRINTTPAATRAVLWTAHSDTKDFRKSRWTSTPFTGSGGVFTAEIPAPASGYVATFGEVTATVGGHPFPTSTQVRILSASRSARSGQGERVTR